MASRSRLLSDEHTLGQQSEMPKRRRLLSEMEAALSPQTNACSVEDVLQLLKLLYAVSSDGSMDNNLLGTRALSVLMSLNVLYLTCVCVVQGSTWRN